jgi:hypothetical protein
MANAIASNFMSPPLQATNKTLREAPASDRHALPAP